MVDRTADLLPSTTVWQLTASVGIFDLLLAVRHGEVFFEHPLQLAAFQPNGSSLDGYGLRREWLGFEAIALKCLGEAGEGDHLCGKQIDEQRHQQTLALYA